ncbi:ABC transporter ATP-binding protein [Effusibacillus lacus]|uniref:ABC transporter n=1 Tax=Effusibacillus lacus TaxID=1348429 RepID=A0A292YIX8_9BACL|nr:ATP-binding cassette domain-containing protein [Effusibacillus lacus]TCS71271.1 ABC-2 type transport system ATP-binding protein [Effusibacillus lacus]GAX89898.1 ABC transporter [Effusibacillus lacus]
MTQGIYVERLSKFFKVHERQAGFRGALQSLFRRQYRLVKAVEDVSFRIEPGEIVGFLGPNGAGKTTTMKVLTGLLHPSSGTVEVAGHVPFRHEPAFKRKFSLVMGQRSQLIWDLPPMETFLVNQVVYEIPDAEFKETLAGLVELLQLEPVLRKPVRQLSLGERMKCELAASLIHRPQILFLDEPTIGLDVNMQESIRQFIKDYNARYNATILLTSHYMADVVALCKRVIIINRGRILYDGELEALVNQYAPYKVANLILKQPVPDHELAMHGEIIAHEYPRVSLRLPRVEVSSRSAGILSMLPISDFTIEDPSMEDVIGLAFERDANATVP